MKYLNANDKKITTNQKKYTTKFVGLVIAILLHVALVLGSCSQRNKSPEQIQHHPFSITLIPLSNSIQFKKNAEKSKTIFANIQTPITSEPLMHQNQDHYFLPQELDREVIILRDPSADLNITINELIIMHLFINKLGTVDDITFEENHLDQATKQLIRKTFLRLEFQPGIKYQKAVRSKIKIKLKWSSDEPIFHQPND